MTPPPCSVPSDGMPCVRATAIRGTACNTKFFFGRLCSECCPAAAQHENSSVAVVNEIIPTVPVEGQEPASELSIMQKLIMPAAEVLAMDATEFSCGDRLLKGMGKKVGKAVAR